MGGEAAYTEVMKKLKILADSAKYDASCASSGSTYRREGATFGTPNEAGICHTWSADGRCVSLFKILLGNTCAYDCAYCVNRRSNDVPRAVFTPSEIADLTAQFYTRNYIEGLFLSSAVLVNPDFTMELMLKTLELLRYEYHFGGYIHIKVIPGASSELIYRAGFLADRVSVNLELPTRNSLQLLAPKNPLNPFYPPWATSAPFLKTAPKTPSPRIRGEKRGKNLRPRGSPPS